MITNKWSMLSNAVHIDRVLRDHKTYPREFEVAWQEAAYWETFWPAWQTGSAAQPASLLESWYAAWGAAEPRPSWCARAALLALITWDHSAKYLTMAPERLMIWGELSGDPACVLLLPYVRARELIAAKESVVTMQHD